MDAGYIKIPPGGAGGRDAGGRPRHHRLPCVDTETHGESGGGHHASGGEERRSGGPTAGEGPLAHAGGLAVAEAAAPRRLSSVTGWRELGRQMFSAVIILRLRSRTPPTRRSVLSTRAAARSPWPAYPAR